MLMFDEIASSAILTRYDVFRKSGFICKKKFS